MWGETPAGTQQAVLLVKLTCKIVRFIQHWGLVHLDFSCGLSNHREGLVLLGLVRLYHLFQHMIGHKQLLTHNSVNH